MGTNLRRITDLQTGDEISTGTVTEAWQSAAQAQIYKLRLSDGQQVQWRAGCKRRG